MKSPQRNDLERHAIEALKNDRTTYRGTVSDHEIDIIRKLSDYELEVIVYGPHIRPGKPHPA